MVIDGPAGPMTVGRILDQAPDVRCEYISDIAAADFGVCMICLASAPTSEEHVPQEGLGGAVMTHTCTRCNSKFGSRVEKELLDWFDDAETVRMSHEAVRGLRSTGRVLKRTNVESRDVFLVIDGYLDPEIHAQLRPGATATMEFRTPDVWRYKVAAMKHAYLAECLHLKGIPANGFAAKVRSDLLAVRDASKDAPFPRSEIAESLGLCRSYAAATGPPLTLVRMVQEGKPERYGIGMAGTIVVEWPFADIDPVNPQLIRSSSLAFA